MPSSSLPRVLILTGAYLPGYKAGGPIRSIANLVDALGDRFELRVITYDRDEGDAAPYDGVPRGTWVSVGKASVFYVSKDSDGLRRLWSLLKSTPCDLVFLSGFFCRLNVKYLVLRKLSGLPRPPVILAPRGEFSREALLVSRTRKRAYISVARLASLVADVHWQASSIFEAEVITATFPRARVRVVPNLAKTPRSAPLPPQLKAPGTASFVWMSRVSRMKNLPFLLRLLGLVDGDATLTVYGAKDDDEWAKVEQSIRASPTLTAQVAYRGVLHPEAVESALNDAHFFVLPTLGENFGHAIYEALGVGRPVVISNRTPFRNLAAVDAGWDTPLEDPAAWLAVLQRCVDMDKVTYVAHSRAAHAFALRWHSSAGAEEAQSGFFSELVTEPS